MAVASGNYSTSLQRPSVHGYFRGPVYRDLRFEVADVRSEVADVRSEVADVKSECADVRSEVADVKSEG